MSEDIALNPCPYCNHKAKYGTAYGQWAGSCPQCSATGPRFQSKEKAAHAWNAIGSTEPVNMAYKKALGWMVFEKMHNENPCPSTDKGDLCKKYNKDCQKCWYNSALEAGENATCPKN